MYVIRYFENHYITVCFLLIALLAYSSTVKMDGVHSYETSVNRGTTRRHITEYSSSHNYRHENFKSN
jgi:hypothetical protein